MSAVAEEQSLLHLFAGAVPFLLFASTNTFVTVAQFGQRIANRKTRCGRLAVSVLCLRCCVRVHTERGLVTRAPISHLVLRTLRCLASRSASHCGRGIHKDKGVQRSISVNKSTRSNWRLPQLAVMIW